MKRIPFIAALCLFAASCNISTAMRNAENKIEAAITLADEVITANQGTFQNACATGQATHDKILALNSAGTIKLSSVNLVKEDQVHQAGLALCANLPTDLTTLLIDIPLIQNYVKALSAFLPTA